MNISTKRLFLKRIHLSDTKVIANLANHPAISLTTTYIPHPCEVQYIENWIKQDIHNGGEHSGFFSIFLKETNHIIGVIGLLVEPENKRAQLDYWLGVHYWNKGYCTEAAKAMLKYGFNVLHLNRIWTYYIEGNVASAQVLKKIGMQREGTLKKHIFKNGVFKDLECYARINA